MLCRFNRHFTSRARTGLTDSITTNTTDNPWTVSIVMQRRKQTSEVKIHTYLSTGNVRNSWQVFICFIFHLCGVIHADGIFSWNVESGVNPLHCRVNPFIVKIKFTSFAKEIHLWPRIYGKFCNGGGSGHPNLSESVPKQRTQHTLLADRCSMLSELAVLR